MTVEKMQKGQTAPLASVTGKISIQLIDDFPNHPYYVFDDDDMFELTNIEDTYIRESDPDSNYYLESRLRIGNYNGTNYTSGKCYTYIRYKSLPILPANSVITSAKLKMTLLSGQTTAPSAALWRVNSSWNSKTLTWNNKPGRSDKSDEIIAPTKENNIPIYYNFDLAYIAASWYNGYGNYGVMLCYNSEGEQDLNSLYSADCGISYNLPELSMTYAELTNVPNGIYYIRNNYSGKYIDVNGQSTASGANIHQWSFHGGTNQQWKITNTGGRWYTLRPQHAPGMAMDVAGSAVNNGTNIRQYTYNGSDAQKFGFVKVNGTYRIVTKVNYGTKNLSLASPFTTNGANIRQWSYCVNDFWVLEEATTTGSAKAYRQVNNININCLGYALERNDMPPLTMSYGEQVQSVFTRLENLIETTMNRNCRQLSGKDDLVHSTREYKIAMRVGPADYHFMVQTNTGGWAHKQGGCNSRNAGMINPSTYDWKAPTAYDSNYNVIAERSYYNSETIYFAVTR